jgi:hypothetical protein
MKSSLFWCESRWQVEPKACSAYSFSWRWRWYVSPKHRLTFDGLHGVISHQLCNFLRPPVTFALLCPITSPSTYSCARALTHTHAHRRTFVQLTSPCRWKVSSGNKTPGRNTASHDVPMKNINSEVPSMCLVVRLQLLLRAPAVYAELSTPYLAPVFQWTLEGWIYWCFSGTCNSFVVRPSRKHSHEQLMIICVISLSPEACLTGHC